MALGYEHVSRQCAPLAFASSCFGKIPRIATGGYLASGVIFLLSEFIHGILGPRFP
jgi:hypothetical protein